MTERQCTLESNKANADRALEIAAGRRYGAAYVEILETDPGAQTVTMLMLRIDDSLVRVVCEWTLNNVWPLCPSTLDGDVDRLPAKGEKGTLYLAESLIDSHDVAATVKWPDDLPPPRPEYRPLRIWPTSIELRGVELATGAMTVGTIDLLDSGASAQGQDITLDAKPMTLQLSQVGFSKFFAPWASINSLRQAKMTLSSTASSSALDRGRAWLQCAAWEELLADNTPSVRGDREPEDYIEARRLLAEMMK